MLLRLQFVGTNEREQPQPISGLGRYFPSRFPAEQGQRYGRQHVENIVFSTNPPAGAYEVWVVNYDARNSGNFTVDVSGRATQSFTGTLPLTAGAPSMHYMFNL